MSLNLIAAQIKKANAELVTKNDLTQEEKLELKRKRRVELYRKKREREEEAEDSPGEPRGLALCLHEVLRALERHHAGVAGEVVAAHRGALGRQRFERGVLVTSRIAAVPARTELRSASVFGARAHAHPWRVLVMTLIAQPPRRRTQPPRRRDVLERRLPRVQRAACGAARQVVPIE